MRQRLEEQGEGVDAPSWGCVGADSETNDVASLSGKRQIGNACLRRLGPLLREPQNAIIYPRCF